MTGVLTERGLGFPEKKPAVSMLISVTDRKFGLNFYEIIIPVTFSIFSYPHS